MLFGRNTISLLCLGLILHGIKLSTSSEHDKKDENNNDISLLEAETAKQNRTGVIDLGTGNPDFSPPKIFQDAMVNAIRGDWPLSQYSDRTGLPRLRKAIASYYSDKLLNLNKTLNPNENVLVTVGATEALYLILKTYTTPSRNQWVLFEPAFHYFYPMINTVTGGKTVFVKLRPNKTGKKIRGHDWVFNKYELKKAFNEKTAGILINNPNNPTGKVFTLEEMKYIGALAKKWDVIVISDEVNEFITFDEYKHIRTATIPNMTNRTLSISSASKVFPATGYRIGWVYSFNASLVNSLKYIHTYIINGPPTPNQEAVALMFENEYKTFGTAESFLNDFKKNMTARKNHLVKLLTDFGISVTEPDGGHYVLANFSTVPVWQQIKRHSTPNSWLEENVGVSALSGDRFYQGLTKDEVPNELLRFTFIRTDKNLTEAEKRFKAWKSSH